IMYSRSGGVGGQLSVRGMNSNNSRSIIAIDGVRVTGRSTLELNMIDPNSLEGIEVIRGSASSLYGSNAINGVINFKTRRYEGDVNQPFKMDAKIRALEFN
ncbi:TonB-dependent receptor plug domain-containing protein, partial [Campylobacter coli]